MDNTETTSETTAPASAPATAPAPEAPGVFTQEQVNRIAAAARAEGKQSAERATQAAPVPPAPAGKVTLESLQAELETTRLRASYEKRAGKAGIPEDVSDDAFDLYRAKPAESRDAWLDGFARKFMPPTGSNPPPAATPPASNTELKPAAAPNTPGRVDPITSGGLVDIFNLTHQQLADLGPHGLRVEFEKITAAGSRMSGAPTRPTVPKR